MYIQTVLALAVPSVPGDGQGQHMEIGNNKANVNVNDLFYMY
jgi:hypothetical protein